VTVPVLIAGAGPVGLSLALGLARHGVRSLVVEKDDGLAEHSRAAAVAARTMEVFRAWGVAERWLEEGELYSRVPIRVVGEAEPRALIDLSSLAAETAYPGMLILSQDRTERLLLEEVERTGLSEVRFGHRLTGFEEDETGVRATIEAPAEAPDGAGYAVRAQYLAGCDGAHSTVRGLLGWRLEGKTYPGRLLLADVRPRPANGVERGDRSFPLFAPRARGVLVGLRLGPGFWRLIASLDPETTEEEATAPAHVDRLADELFGPGPNEHVWASVFRIHRRLSPRFRRGRVLLLGDAGHLNSPAGGQGMNSGIHDAFDLAWKLARILSPPPAGADPEALLASFEAERHHAAEEVNRFTGFLTRFAFPPVPGVRPLLLRLALPALRRPALMARAAPRIAMLRPSYGESPLLAGGAPAPVGERLPDAEIEGSAPPFERLHDAVRSGPVLLLGDDEAGSAGWQLEAVEAAVADLGVTVNRLLVSDVRSAGDRALRVTRPAVAEAVPSGRALLLRPDHHVGWLAERPTPEAIRAGVALALGAPG
jgi:2-polyprenyl-6-methoxyphenol hydroxylase-like FAD-dependent oxidoreductase